MFENIFFVLLFETEWLQDATTVHIQRRDRTDRHHRRQLQWWDERGIVLRLARAPPHL